MCLFSCHNRGSNLAEGAKMLMLEFRVNAWNSKRLDRGSIQRKSWRQEKGCNRQQATIKNFSSSSEPLPSRLPAICTAVASRFVVDRACLKFAPFYGLSIETHLFTAAYEWRLYEKLGKDPGSVGCKQLWRQLTRGGDGQAGETCAMQSFKDSWKV